MFGAHDRLVIADVPDSISAAALSVTVGSTGAFKSLETHELLTQEQVGPATVHFVDELPNTPSGKVQRYVLRQRRRDEVLVRTAERG
jgi:acyl-coenzyme A synthetase/AMP-(fatty) acid ligase